MAVRAALGLCLAALAWAGAARADNPACAQYREPMAYNACLAQHGPKANIGPSHAAPQPGRGAQPPRARSLPLAGAPAPPRARTDACTWSFRFGKRRLEGNERGARTRGNRQAPRSAPRAVGDQRRGGPRFTPSPRARLRGIGNFRPTAAQRPAERINDTRARGL